jgi:hypothetical protein
VRCKTTRGGTVEVTLDEAEVALVRAIPDQLRTLYDAPTDDPTRSRLFPRAYLDPTEERAEQEWEALAHPELLRQRLDGLERLLDGLERAEPRRGGLRVGLTPEDVSVWVAVLNDARLAMGARLDVTEETDLRWIARDDPQRFEKAAYGWLTALQGELVEALLGGLPD